LSGYREYVGKLPVIGPSPWVTALREQVAADERAPSRRALAAQDLLAVAVRPRLVDAFLLEGLQLLGDAGAEV
jgi:hypothetical protein